MAASTRRYGDLFAPGRSSGTRNPERPIIFACASVGLLFALLAVLERVGVERSILGALAVALPIVAAAVLALLGRTIERLPFAVDGMRGGTLAGGLALGAEWMGVWLVPFMVLAPALAAPAILGFALGLVALILAAIGAMRRVGALSLPAFLARRTGSGWASLLLVPATLAAVAGLLVFQLALLHALLLPLVGTGADRTLAAMGTLAALVCLLGGQRSLTLVNAFLAFFLALAMVVPALAVLAGVEGLTAALPLDLGFARLLPFGSGLFGPVLALVALALVALALPTHAMRLAAVRTGGLTQAGAWAMLTAYVTMSAAALAFSRSQLTSGLLVSANGETSILSVLPALGWLGAVWAGLAMSLFAFGAILGRDVRWRAPALSAAPWMDAKGLALMRLTLIAAALLGALWTIAPPAWIADLLNAEGARLAIEVTVWTSAGCLAPALIVGIVWRHLTWPGLFAGQVAAVAVVAAGLALLDPLLLALAAGIANTLAIFGVSLVTPRRWRPLPSLVKQMREG